MRSGRKKGHIVSKKTKDKISATHKRLKISPPLKYRFLSGENNPAWKGGKNNQKGYKREKWLKMKFNLSIEEYNKILEKQNNSCAICKQDFDTIKQETNKSLCVDHNHENGEIRGLLCNNCNRGLGFFKDNAVSLLEAIKYLDKQK